MKIHKNDKQILLVLVPHRDTRVELRKYSDLLLKAGLTGVYQFPLAAPLASLSQPLNANELKYLTRSLRENTGSGKITAAETSITAFPPDGKDTLFGPRLDSTVLINMFGDAAVKIKNLFSPLIIGTYFVPDSSSHNLRLIEKIPPVLLSFRAGAVANMIWQPFQAGHDTGYKWKIGKLCWLPNVKRGFTNIKNM